MEEKPASSGSCRPEVASLILFLASVLPSWNTALKDLVFLFVCLYFFFLSIKSKDCKGFESSHTPSTNTVGPVFSPELKTGAVSRPSPPPQAVERTTPPLPMEIPEDSFAGRDPA